MCDMSTLLSPERAPRKQVAMILRTKSNHDPFSPWREQRGNYGSMMLSLTEEGTGSCSAKYLDELQMARAATNEGVLSRRQWQPPMMAGVSVIFKSEWY